MTPNDQSPYEKRGAYWTEGFDATPETGRM